MGQNNSLTLAREFISATGFLQLLQQLMHSDQHVLETLYGLDGLGEKTLQGICEFAKHEHNIQITAELIQILEIKDYVQAQSSKISGLNLVFTGSLSAMSRSEAKAVAESLGAKVSSAISANTDVLVAGEKSGSKAKKAQELGVKVVSEEEWLEMTK
jgi:DNA ligase (NAD+)